jgi:chromosome partitioning protein
MKTLVVMNEKGGVGKTNIVAHAAWYFAERYRTLVIDLDQQANLSYTLQAYACPVESVQLFGEPTIVPPREGKGGTLTRSTRALMDVERAPDSIMKVFHSSIRANDDAYDICLIDTPPALGMRTFAGLLAADAVLAPIGVNDYSLAGITELMRAIKGVATHYKRKEPHFLGLLPSIFDRKSKRERDLFEQLAGQLGKVLFPGIIAKRDVYAKAGSEGIPAWSIKGQAGREAGEEIRAIFSHIETSMELTHG